MKCKCDPNIVEKQEYKRCITLINPFVKNRNRSLSGKLVSIDICILPDILALWEIGIQTDNSCCGHNIKDDYGFISVVDEHFERMLKLGYKIDISNVNNPKTFLWKENRRQILKNIKKESKIMDLTNYLSVGDESWYDDTK